MTRQRIIVIAATFAIASAAHAEEQWAREAPNPHPLQSAADVGFLDDQHGYMVGLQETTLVTHDGGLTWAPAPLPRHDNTCVFVLDSQHAWLFGNYGVRTTDGGRTWQDLGLQTANEATFLTPDFGWISGGYAARVTHDGGLTWNDAIIGSYRVIYPDFANDQVGIGRQANFGTGIWRTANGGQSWTKVLDTNITNVAFVNETVAIAVGGGQIHRSTDAGLTWSVVASGFGAYPQIIVFDESTVIVNAQNAYKRSDDAGQTWTSLPVTPGNLYKIVIRDGHDAYGLTGNGNIAHSTDAFLTWELVYGDTHMQLSGIDFLPDGSIVAAGTDYILKSVDGMNWDVINSGVKGTVIDVEMFDAQRGIALANGGYVLRTTDGGDQWVPTRPSYEQGYGWNYCKDVFILNENIAYVAGGDGPGPMIKTTDGGETWEPMAYPTTTQIESVWFVDEMHGWIGRGYTTGWIYRTADGGETWEEVWPQSYGGIWDIQFHDLNLGWAQRGGSYILRTTDGGDSWTEHLLPNPGSYVEFEFIDESVGYVVGAFGKIAKTINGGSSWQLLDSGTGENLLDLEVVSRHEVWAVGNNNTRLHTTDGGLTWQNDPVTGIELPDFQAWHAISVLDDGPMRVAGNVGWILRNGPNENDRTGDIDGDGAVDVVDLVQLVSAWGACAIPADCPADLDGSGAVDVLDLIILIGNWG